MTSTTEGSRRVARPAHRRGRGAEFADNAGAVGDLVLLVWQRKLWWLVPLLLALLVLGALVFVGSTPIGAFLYPVF